MPEVDNTITRYITVKDAIEMGLKAPNVPWEDMVPNAEVLLCEDEEDLNKLVISIEAYFGDCGYTSYQFIYEVNFTYSELNAKQLLYFLRENIREGQLLELWSVWIGNDELNIAYTRCRYEELSLNHLIQMYNWQHEKYIEKSCLVIER